MAPTSAAASSLCRGVAHLAALVVILTSQVHAVQNVTFTLEKTGNSANVTDMWVGTRLSFKLTVEFPVGITDMLIELFAPDNDTIIMSLCNVQAVKGANLDASLPGNVVMDSLNGSNIFYDRAIIDFGNVTYSSGNDGKIVVTYDAIMIHNDQTVDGSIYWVSAGAEYNNEDEVWVGQASFTAHTNDTLSSTTPVFNMSGPSQMPVGSAAVFTVDMLIPHPSAYISFDAFAPINTTDVMSVVGVKVKDTGVNYDCLFKADQHVQTLYADGNTKGWARGHLDLGVMTNKGVRDQSGVTDNDRITVEFVVWLDTSAPVGVTYWVGGAVELGDTQIWCGQMQITTLPRYDTPDVTPLLDVTYEGGVAKLSQAVPLTAKMDITLPTNSTSDYTLEILSPIDSDKAVLKLCALTLVTVGENMPATSTSDKQAVYSSRVLNASVADRVVLDVGRVSNVGDWGHQNATTNANNDQLSFTLVVMAIDHTLAVHGAEFSLTVGIVRNGQQLHVGTINVTVDTTLEGATNASSPLWRLEYSFGDDNIKIGSATDLLFTVTTTPSAVYSPFDLEIIMPNATTDIPFRICSVRVLSAGKNLPCLQPDFVSNLVTYKSDFDSGGAYDRAVLNLGNLCNIEIVNDTKEDEFQVSAVVQLTEAATATSVYWLSAGVMYSSTRMWIGQLAATAVTPGSWDTTAPQVFVVVNSTAPEVYKGYGKVYTVVIKPHPATSMPIKVSVDTSSVDISICDMRVIAVGSNFPCVAVSSLNTTYSTDPATGKVSTNTLDMGIVTNIGMQYGTNDSAWDDSIIQVQIVAKVLPTATATGLQTFTVTVDNTATTAVENLQLTIASAPLTMNTTNISTVDMSIGPISGADTTNLVAVGEAKRMLVDLYVPQDLDQPCQELEVKMLAPLDSYGLLEVTYIGLVEMGDNFKCLQRLQTTTSYLKRPHNAIYQDIGSVHLGVVCNTGLSNDPTANRVRVETVVRVPRNDSTAPGTEITLSAGISTNNQQILIVQSSLFVVDNFTDHYVDNVTLVNGTALRLNVSDGDTLTARPGDLLTIPLSLFVPLYSVSTAQFDLECPMNTSASCTFVEFRPLSSGTNLARWGHPEDYKINASSSLSTSQNDKAYVDMGILTNAGCTDRIGEMVDADNAISVEVDVKVADAISMENSTEMWISFGLKIAKYIVILDVKVVIQRDGTEKPVLVCQADVDTDNSTSEYIEVDLILRHDNETSRAECQNTTAIVYLPPYLSFHSVVSANLTPATAMQVNGAVLLNYGSLYFTDVVALTLAFATNSTARMPEDISGARSVVTMETVCNMYHRENSPYSPVQDFCSEMCHVNFTATVTKESGITCTSSALGLASSAILDCQLSSSAYSLTPATDGRQDASSGGWAPFVREGSLAALRCFQVCLGTKTFVDKLTVQQSGPSNATKIATLFSDDGRAWLQGEEVSLDPSAEQQDLALSQPTAARYVRLCVRDDTDPTQRLGLRFELHGCLTASPMTDVCSFCSTMPTAPVLPEFSPRSFLVYSTATQAKNSVFVCDGTGQTGSYIQHACFKSILIPTPSGNWKELDPRLDCMVGYDSETQELFATGQGGSALFLSADEGATWTVTRPEKLAESVAKPASTFVAAVKVPWSDDSALQFGAGIAPSNSKYSDDGTVNGHVLASFDGVRFFDTTWVMALNWTSCCS